MGRELMDKETFSQILKVLAAAYPKFEGLDKEGMTAYYAILGDLPAMVLKASTMQYASEHKWFPTAAELRQTAFDLMDQADGKITAPEAWGRVCKAASRIGHMRVPKFEDPLVWQAVEDVGGWRHICLGPEDMMHTTRARFIQAFEARRKQERARTRMLPTVKEIVQALPSGERPQLEEGDEN